MKNLGLDEICLLGIAKARVKRSFSSSEVHSTDERIVFPERRDGLLVPDGEMVTKILRPGSVEFRLVTRVRDEAHRFAIAFHRTRRDQIGRGSLLYGIEGLGPKRRQKLLRSFESLQDIVAASPEEIAQKAQIPVSVATLIKSVIEKASLE